MKACQFHYDEQKVDLRINKMSIFEEVFIDFKIEKTEHYDRYKMVIHPKKPILLKSLTFTFDHSFGQDDQVFCNGFQSWSESREFGLGEEIPSLMGIARKHLQYYGDSHFPQIKRGKGHLHSWTYGYTRQGQQFHFIGSLQEQNAFTLIQYDTKKNEIQVEKECEGVTLTHSFEILDLVVIKGSEDAVFDQYFDLMSLPPLKASPATGWTSWYNYYTNISEEIIFKNLDAFVEKKVDIDIFQIDDGYTKRIGDWLTIKDTFPNGMAPVAQKIKANGYKAGLWLAPFICEEKSDIFQNKKDWLLKDDKGQFVKAGYNPGWSGWFYVLDFYNKEVQTYLTGVIHTVLHKWGYDMLKLDFLYAVCIQPRENKTRGQVMSAAMDFLRTAAGDQLLLGCGVPLGSAFGKVDYCRIGADIHLKWEHQFLKLLRNRERVSTILSLRSTIGRRQLNGRAFHNDPDVFILRDANNKLTLDQQYSILLINNLLGNLLFTSDFIGDYGAEQWAEYETVFQLKTAKVSRLEQVGMDRLLIYFNNLNKTFVAACNLTKSEVDMNIQGQQIKLNGYESIILGVK